MFFDTVTYDNICSALLISGGHDGPDSFLTSVNLLSSSCQRMGNVPALPEGRSGHTMNGNMVCGGSDQSGYLDNCLSLVEGQWRETHKLGAGGRGGHCSWGVRDGVVLIGGQYGHGSLATAEFVSGELYTKSTMLFTLKYNIRYILILDIKIHVVGL